MAFKIENGVLKRYYEEEGVTDVIIPDDVTSIGEYAFWGCESLESITISDSVTSICEYVFADCQSLKSITIPNSIKSIDEYAFGDCKKLEYIILKGKKAEIKISTDKYFLTSTGCVSAEAVRLLKFIEADDNEKEAAFAEIKKSCYKILVAVFLVEEYDSETAKTYLKRINKNAVEYFTALGKQEIIDRLISAGILK